MKKIILFFLTLNFMVSCTDETIIYNTESSDVSLENSTTILEESVIFDDAGVLPIYNIGDASTSGKTEDLAGDYPLTLVAQIHPPSFSGGENLTASHVFIDADFAYVSYNTVEDGYAGGVDIINIKDPNNPVITSRLYYLNADVNSVVFENGFVYMVGGLDAEQSATADFNSFTVRIAAPNGRFNISGLLTGFQEGFNSTAVQIKGNEVLVASGQDGVLRAYNKADLSISKEAIFPDLRSVQVADNVIAVYDGTKGINVLDENLSVIKEINVDADFGDFAKRTISMLPNTIYAAEGAKGAAAYDIHTGTLLERLPIPLNPVGVAITDQVTNAVAVNDDVLLMANGGAGLCIATITKMQTQLVGVIGLEGSINYVASKGDYIFAASGKSGLQIIKMNKPVLSLADNCQDLNTYQGIAKLTVPVGGVEAYKGAKRFNNITVEGSLLLCGSWTAQNRVLVNENALFELNGTIIVGSNNKKKNIVIEKNATFRVEGNLTIYGDLILKENAKLEFLGNSSLANIYGEVKKETDAKVSGNFTDYKKKF